ncbi:MAG: hypothetical protein WC208_07330 [Gallionella sp.]|jgi:hypothetical protein
MNTQQEETVTTTNIINQERVKASVKKRKEMAVKSCAAGQT